MIDDTNLDLKRVERRLREQLDRSERQLAELETTLTDMFSDHDTIQEDQDQARLVVDTVRSEVRHTRHALERIEDGSYGSCIGCGGSIDPERLDAIPIADRCGRCA